MTFNHKLLIKLSLEPQIQIPGQISFPTIYNMPIFQKNFTEQTRKTLPKKNAHNAVHRKARWIMTRFQHDIFSRNSYNTFLYSIVQNYLSWKMHIQCQNKASISSIQENGIISWPNRMFTLKFLVQTFGCSD